MIYVWDTDICIFWLKGSPVLRQKVQESANAEMGITIVTLAELRFGAHKSDRVEENLVAVDNLMQGVHVLSMDRTSADHFGRIKADLQKRGETLEDMDILIASITLANEGILVTNNVAHLARIDSLVIENWMDQTSDSA